VNYTREPLIESVITPKEGYKLVVRCSKKKEEEYMVDAVEIISFGTAIFFRSQEASKSFLLPVSDYEILEIKEARMVLKNASIEKSIKIGGGKDASKKEEKSSEKKRKRLRKKRLEGKKETEIVETRKLIPPPTTLIQEKLVDFKKNMKIEEDILPPIEELKKEEIKPASEEEKPSTENKEE